METTSTITAIYTGRPGNVAEKMLPGTKLRTTQPTTLFEGLYSRIYHKPETGCIQIKLDLNNLESAIKESKQKLTDANLPLFYLRNSFYLIPEWAFTAGEETKILESSGFKKGSDNEWELLN